MTGQHPSPMRERTARLRISSAQAEQIRLDKLRRFREGLSNSGRYRPEEIEVVMRMYEVMLRGKP